MDFPQWKPSHSLPLLALLDGIFGRWNFFGSKFRYTNINDDPLWRGGVKNLPELTELAVGRYKQRENQPENQGAGEHQDVGDEFVDESNRKLRPKSPHKGRQYARLVLLPTPETTSALKTQTKFKSVKLNWISAESTTRLPFGLEQFLLPVLVEPPRQGVTLPSWHERPLILPC